MKLIKPYLTLVAFAFLTILPLRAGEQTDAQLLKEAKATRQQAEQTALAKVPNGKITAGELEQEHGLLIWSFDIAQPRSKNIQEVQVDAKTGKIASVTTETPGDQAKEKAADKAKK